MQEINPEFNTLWNRAKLTSVEWLSVIIAGLSVLIALTALFQSIYANVRSELQQVMIIELKGDVDVLRIRTAKMDAWLKAHGVPTEEIYNE